MKKLMNKKFNKGIQKQLNKFFFDEEYHQYTLGELLKIVVGNIIVLSIIILLSTIA